MRTVWFLILGLGLMAVGCGPRDHLGPDMGRSYRAVFSPRLPEAKQPVAPIAAKAGLAIHARYMEALKGEQRSRFGEGGGILDTSDPMATSLIPSLGGGVGGDEGRHITLSGD